MHCFQNLKCESMHVKLLLNYRLCCSKPPERQRLQVSERFPGDTGFCETRQRNLQESLNAQLWWMWIIGNLYHYYLTMLLWHTQSMVGIVPDLTMNHFQPWGDNWVSVFFLLGSHWAQRDSPCMHDIRRLPRLSQSMCFWPFMGVRVLFWTPYWFLR